MASIEAMTLGLLAMDVYSRGYNAALSDGLDETPIDESPDDIDGFGELVGESRNVGSAEVFWSLQLAGMQRTAEDIGFHAIAY